LHKTFLILRIQAEIINVLTSLCKVLIILLIF